MRSRCSGVSGGSTWLKWLGTRTPGGEATFFGSSALTGGDAFALPFGSWAPPESVASPSTRTGPTHEATIREIIRMMGTPYDGWSILPGRNAGNDRDRETLRDGGGEHAIRIATGARTVMRRPDAHHAAWRIHDP